MQLLSILLLFLTGQIFVVNSSCCSKLENSLFDDLIGMMLKLKGTGGHGTRIELSPNKMPAFTAYRDTVQDLSSREIVRFDKVWTNNLNAYDVTTGVFTAPITGLYHFSAVVMSEAGKNLFLHLWHNDTRTAASYTHGDGYKTGTFDIVLNVKKDDRIYIRCRGNDNQRIFSNADSYITFSGYLIAK
ncbi:complement C1q tumor necrosis factor-related protein 6-like [Mytilus californianus]|uniref:complement C1q tumor necrosis factor-related protein 6-like n=1 Tax=Mytilus californianus TaxID=6549 RepID=UPI0022450A65|nr:complement C1q tumor necrosis factor-related protein 6-like [Mytilus californianus]